VTKSNYASKKLTILPTTDHTDHSKSEYNKGNGLKDVMYESINS
jgi:hypothetical protein